MGSLKATLCAGAALASALAPTAYAADGEGVSVSPSAPASGIEPHVADCAERTAAAGPAAFVADARLTPAAKDGVLVGPRSARSDTEAGAYTVRTGCDDTREGTVTEGERRHPAALAAPVDAGGGGTARLAGAGSRDEARPEPPGTAHTVTGLVLAGIAAVAVALRGVRGRSRGTD
ncbi:hypothetical protein [Streptomyces sp. NPDC000351]|uniref:hypothetical protein n=1 Tax=Streptomyces sp. NPDC000351 TaxID=3154250 RepID=UPI003326573D